MIIVLSDVKCVFDGVTENEYIGILQNNNNKLHVCIQPYIPYIQLQCAFGLVMRTMVTTRVKHTRPAVYNYYFQRRALFEGGRFPPLRSPFLTMLLPRYLYNILKYNAAAVQGLKCCIEVQKKTETKLNNTARLYLPPIITHSV